MTDMMVKIVVEVLDILATATKEMRQSRFSEVILPDAARGSYIMIYVQKNS